MSRVLVGIISIILVSFPVYGQSDLINLPSFKGNKELLYNHFDQNLYLDLEPFLISDTIKIKIEFDKSGSALYCSIAKNTFEIQADTIKSAVQSMPLWFPDHQGKYEPINYITTLNIIVLKNEVVGVLIDEDVSSLIFIDVKP